MENIEKKIGKTTLRIGLPEDNKPDAQRMGVSLDLPDGSTRSHVFNNFGSGDWRDFLCSLDRGYVGDKFFGGGTKQVSLTETIKRMESGMRDSLADADESKDTDIEDTVKSKVRRFRETIREARQDFKDCGHPLGSPAEAVEVESLVRAYAGVFQIDSPGSMVGTRESPSFTDFMERIWDPMVASLAAEREMERQANVEPEGFSM